MHRSSIWYEGRETERYSTGNLVSIRVLPDNPEMARLPGAFTHYLWAVVGFTASLFAIVLLTSVFFLHEGLLGIESSKPGISLFRSVNWNWLLGLLIAAWLLIFVVQRTVAPWMGVHEVLSVATGDLLKMPYLLERNGEPEPGRHLNRAERAFFNLPILGGVFAGLALESVLEAKAEALTSRYAAALAGPTPEFRVVSNRALGSAAANGKIDLVRILLAHGIPPDAAFMAGEEPNRQAARADREDIVLILWEAGAQPGDSVRPLLVDALEKRSRKTVRTILNRSGADPSWREAVPGRTLAEWALLAGMPDVATELAQRGVPFTVPDFFQFAASGDIPSLERALPRREWAAAGYRGESLLHIAARYRRLDLAGLLLTMGADPNSPADESRRTPLMEAVQAGEPEMVRLLASRPGIQWRRTANDLMSALSYAIAAGRWDLAEILVENGSSLDAQIGRECDTPLHVAARNGDAVHVRWLLSKGADPGWRNCRQLTPAEVCESGEILRLLESLPPHPEGSRRE